MSSMLSSRRSFLKVAAAATAFGIIGLRRKSAHAAEPVRAKRVFLLYAGGGLRSSAAFNASTAMALNPWGVLGTFGAVKLGRVLTLEPGSLTTAAPSWPGAPQVPDITQVASRSALLASVDHAPRLPRGGDHTDDTPRMGTGYFGKHDAPGLLTVINKYLGGPAPAPICNMGTPFSAAAGAWVPFTPTEVVSYQLPSKPPGGGTPTVGRPLEDALDKHMTARRQGLSGASMSGYNATKSALRKYGPVLANKALHIGNPSYHDEVLDGITNRMLLEAVGEPFDQGAPAFAARDVGVALRLMQMGAPAVGVSIGGFDLHSEERQKGPNLYTRYARYVAGIHFALSRIPDPAGGTLLDSTLVVTTSEFGRSPGSETTGFNNGDGSDHGSGDVKPVGLRTQSHLVFGAGVKPKVINPTDDSHAPLSGKPNTTHGLLTTICSALGVPGAETEKLWPSGSQLHTESAPLFDLWA